MKFKLLVYFSVSLLSFRSFAQGTACTLGNYMAAIRIPIASYPYVATSAPALTVSAINVGAPTLGNSTYSCVTDQMAGASPAWWLNGPAPGQSLTFNFSSPVTNLTFLINGTNSTEIFYIVSNSTCAISLSNICSLGFTSVGGTLTAGPTAALGSLITVNNPGGATQYIMTHNGLGAGSRVTLLDCFVKGSGTCVLPVELVSFNAECTAKNLVKVNWETADEKDSDYFTIERSIDVQNWETIKRIESESGTGHQHYSCLDVPGQNRIYYYRLRQTDMDGNFKLYPPAKVEVTSDKTRLSIKPNPAENEVILSGLNLGEIFVFDQVGNVVLRKDFNHDHEAKLDLSELKSGFYFLRSGENNYKIIKQ